LAIRISSTVDEAGEAEVEMNKLATAAAITWTFMTRSSSKTARM
jgi:hypothetical protein